MGGTRPFTEQVMSQIVPALYVDVIETSVDQVGCQINNPPAIIRNGATDTRLLLASIKSIQFAP